MLFPRFCVLCQLRADGVCIRCLADLPPAPDLAPPPGFVDFGSLLSYEGQTRKLIAAIKFEGHKEAVKVPARVLSRLVEVRPSCVTWAPTSPSRRRERGFDQAELLARTVARELRRPCVSTLRRSSGSGHQTGRNRSERLVGASFSYDGHTTRGPDMGRVLIVDDVRTTGATLSAAGDTLLEAGAREVSALTLAVTL